MGGGWGRESGGRKMGTTVLEQQIKIKTKFLVRRPVLSPATSAGGEIKNKFKNLKIKESSSTEICMQVTENTCCIALNKKPGSVMKSRNQAPFIALHQHPCYILIVV